MRRVNALKSDLTINEIRKALESGRIDIALELSNEDDASFLAVLFTIWVSAATLQITLTASEILAARRAAFPFSGVLTSLGFDPTNPRNAETLRQIGTGILSNLNQTKRNSIDLIISNGFVNGKSQSDIAEDIRRFAGLAPRQIEAVLNYERLLRQNSKEALNRVLRDKGFDERLRSGKPLSEKQIQNMVDAYTKRMLQKRAETIARTVAGDIINEAMEEGAKQALEAAGLPEDAMVKEWRSKRDSVVRPTHKPHTGMDGQVVPLSGYFVSPSGARLKHPHDGNAPLSETANCRCRQLIYVKPEYRNL